MFDYTPTPVNVAFVILIQAGCLYWTMKSTCPILRSATAVISMFAGFVGGVAFALWAVSTGHL
jgi:nitrogen fixation-related uncharacterized protein